ncbi:PDZ domain-containing protein [Nonomuraea sp. KC401]|uniref:S1C family serine protease n=1 Tax=unclassified Nonomuraea TaxID=2593643 RepID=UPI0010FEB190|nr:MULTISPECIES: trypsin-like peptidase domain-containing protein [unclassified Nonomuraea]NBE95981.1 PDZ domain-containing protein [Nonomuraea sp. K271]TLF65966.1 PDZ domain-containing protein [Nonomuraea sp. KC401]
MTDETRPNEGRTTSDYPEPQGRPDFLPAEDASEYESRRPEPPASFGASWGDPSGRSEGSGTPPYDRSAGESPAEGGSAPDDPGQSGSRLSAPSFGPPDPDARNHEAPPPEPGSRPYDGPPPDGDSRSYEGAPPDRDSRSHDGPFFGLAESGTQENLAFGRPDGGESGYGRPDGRPGGGGGYGRPDGGTRAYEAPPFGGPPFGGTPPPPPPRQALGMGAGWAPPPSGAHSHVSRPRRIPSTGFLISTAVAIALVASLLGSVGTYLLTKPASDNDPGYSLGPVPTGATDRAPDSVAGVATRVLPSVVSIEAGNGMATEGASGSGFLIKNGYVVTNNHVVAPAAKGGEIRIMFNNRKTTTARIVGRDPGSDLAVIKPEDTFGTPEITLGNSDQVVVGDPVIAVGSPLGLTGTVTTGIVSSLNRPVIAGDDTGASSEETAYISAIQTDAAINPGNSGGPLVNGRGEVVGVNSAIATLSRSLNSQSGSIGLGFAIPVNQTRRVAEELITTGRAKRPKIGILLDRDYKGQGVRIASEPVSGQQPVDADGPAGKAGLKAGDVILEIDGLALQDGNELIALIRSKAPGSTIDIKFQRAGQEQRATLTVEADDQPAPSPS